MRLSYSVRGYQFKSEQSEPRRNPPAYRALNDAKEKLAEAETLSVSADAGDLEKRGLGEGLGEKAD